MCNKVGFVHVFTLVERCPRITLQNTNIQNVVGAYGDEILVQCTDPNTLENYDTEYTTTCNQYLQWEPVKLCNSKLRAILFYAKSIEHHTWNGLIPFHLTIQGLTKTGSP